MMINSNAIVSATEANQNFSKVARMAETHGRVVVFKNNLMGINLSYSGWREVAYAFLNSEFSGGQAISEKAFENENSTNKNNTLHYQNLGYQ